MTRYVARHESQYGADRSPRTRSSGCTWTSGAIGIDASTGGRIDPEPDQVLAKVKVSEETNPTTPGWSLPDLAKASSRLGAPFAVRSGAGWAGVRAARNAGLYVVLQGDSDRFPDGCSGEFDGDHAIGITPGVTNAAGEWGIHDPICPRLTYQPESVLRAYAEKLASTVRFGVYTQPVPMIEEDDDVKVYSVPGIVSAEAPAGTPIYAGPTGPQTGATKLTHRYLLVGQSDATSTPLRYLVDGAEERESGHMGWLPASALTKRRDETFNAGVAAAAKAAATARR